MLGLGEESFDEWERRCRQSWIEGTVCASGSRQDYAFSCSRNVRHSFRTEPKKAGSVPIRQGPAWHRGAGDGFC